MITLYACVTTPVPVQITVALLRLPPSWLNHAYLSDMLVMSG